MECGRACGTGLPAQTSSLAFRLLSPLFWGQEFSSCLHAAISCIFLLC